MLQAPNLDGIQESKVRRLDFLYYTVFLVRFRIIRQMLKISRDISTAVTLWGEELKTCGNEMVKLWEQAEYC